MKLVPFTERLDPKDSLMCGILVGSMQLTVQPAYVQSLVNQFTPPDLDPDPALAAGTYELNLLKKALEQRIVFSMGRHGFETLHNKILPLVAEDATPAETLDHVWGLAEMFADIPQDPQTRQVAERAAAEGAAAMYTPKAKMTSQDMLDFVNGYLDGSIYLLEDLGEDASLVLMPLGFGMFKYPDEGEPLADLIAGDAPQEPSPPTLEDLPPQPKAPDQPKKPKARQPDKDTLQKYADLSWEDPDESDRLLREYHADLERKNAKAMAEYEAKLANFLNGTEHKARIAAWEAECDAIKARNEDAQNDYKNNAKKRYQDALKQWATKDALYRFAVLVLDTVRLQNVGTVYADSRKHHTLSRAINGLPMFTECVVVSKQDLASLQKLLQAEHTRRQAQKKELAEMLGEDPNAKPPERPKTVFDLVQEAEPVCTPQDDGTFVIEKKWTNPDNTQGSIQITSTTPTIGKVIHLS